MAERRVTMTLDLDADEVAEAVRKYVGHMYPGQTFDISFRVVNRLVGFGMGEHNETVFEGARCTADVSPKTGT